MSAQRIVGLGARIRNGPAIEASVCIGGLCRLTAIFALSQPVEGIVLFRPEIVYPSIESFCFHGNKKKDNGLEVFRLGGMMDVM